MSDFFVCSKSTKKYISGNNFHLVESPPNSNILKQAKTFSRVIAIGGGAVIDTAKILSKEPIICYPTTASGSSDTSHAVYWDGYNKKNFQSFLPKRVILNSEFVKDLPKHLVLETKCDLIAHCLDVLWSKDKTKESQRFANEGLNIINEDSSNYGLIKAGRLGGKAIEITATTILHALSYPLTGVYNISHGLALSFLIPRISSLMNTGIPKIKYTQSLGNIDWDLVVSKASEYPKFFNTNQTIDKRTIISSLS